MLIKTAVFEKSTPELKGCPDKKTPEYAFIGRSNVGKSSLINYITGIKNLAKTSSTPGKTQLLNYFLIDNQWYLVDLPGLGYAKVSKLKRGKWLELITAYLKKRTMLMCTFFLIDSRLSPQKIDVEFMEWMAENELPFVIVFTKTDKLKSQALKRNIDFYKTELLKTWEELPQIFITSSEKQKGKEDIIQFIYETNKLFI